jgi:hypothetical protein
MAARGVEPATLDGRRYGCGRFTEGMLLTGCVFERTSHERDRHG